MQGSGLSLPIMFVQFLSTSALPVLMSMLYTHYPVCSFLLNQGSILRKYVCSCTETCMFLKSLCSIFVTMSHSPSLPACLSVSLLHCKY